MRSSGSCPVAIAVTNEAASVAAAAAAAGERLRLAGLTQPFASEGHRRRCARTTGGAAELVHNERKSQSVSAVRNVNIVRDSPSRKANLQRPKPTGTTPFRSPLSPESFGEVHEQGSVHRTRYRIPGEPKTPVIDLSIFPPTFTPGSQQFSTSAKFAIDCRQSLLCRGNGNDARLCARNREEHCRKRASYREFGDGPERPQAAEQLRVGSI